MLAQLLFDDAQICADVPENAWQLMSCNSVRIQFGRRVRAIEQGLNDESNGPMKHPCCYEGILSNEGMQAPRV